ncbi:aminopeptidase P family N-terminal domain-containing protein, partial [Paenibacillus validus]|uniref:M24 family metallopeptidase n=1 Tax=Paenibacillus validus TaxID=44253 RepID=UPI002E245D81
MSEYKQRVGRLQHKLQTGGFDGMVVTQNVDLYYLAGSMQTGYLIVPASGDPKFFVRRSVARAEEESAWPVEPLGSLREFAGQLGAAFPDLAAITGRSPVKLAAEFDVLPVQLFQRLQQSLAHVEWKDGSALIRETRMIKSPFEIEAIRSAARVINDAFEDAFGWLKPGMTELEAMSRMEYFVRERGHIGIMRLRGYNQEVITGMLWAGDAAATPTYFDGPA